MTKNYRVWLQYFDCSLTRRMGRRVSKDLCIGNPSIEEILRACIENNLRCIHEDKKYPRAWYLRQQGLITIEFEGKKNNLIKILATTMRRFRYANIS